MKVIRMSQLEVKKATKTITSHISEKTKNALIALQNNYQYKTINEWKLKDFCKKYDITLKTLLSYVTYAKNYEYSIYEYDNLILNHYHFKKISVI